MSDVLAFFDPEIAIPLSFLGVAFGAFVLWHFPSARLGWGVMLFLLTVSDLMPWVFIIAFRGIEYATHSDPTFATWYRSVGTMFMFLGFDLGAAAGIGVRARITARNAKRAAVLPHGIHHERQS